MERGLIIIINYGPYDDELNKHVKQHVVLIMSFAETQTMPRLCLQSSATAS